MGATYHTQAKCFGPFNHIQRIHIKNITCTPYEIQPIYTYYYLRGLLVLNHILFAELYIKKI